MLSHAPDHAFGEDISLLYVADIQYMISAVRPIAHLDVNIYPSALLRQKKKMCSVSRHSAVM